MKAGYQKQQLPKMGHGGTLDPFATGLMLILLGETTRLAELFLGSNKCYAGEIQFGAATLSGDLETPITEKANQPESFERIVAAARSFVGSYVQKPPMFSAIKIKGKKLYELARKDKTVDRDVVERKIDEFEIINYQNGRSAFRVKCSSGTYIRVLAEDLAKRSSSLAHLTSLRRLSSGEFHVEQATTMDDLEQELSRGEELDALAAFIPILELFPKELRLEVPKQLLQPIVQGKEEPLLWVEMQLQVQVVELVLTYQGSLVALLELDDLKWKYKRVLVSLIEHKLRSDI